jgi:hypothetical protein
MEEIKNKRKEISSGNENGRKRRRGSEEEDDDKFLSREDGIETKE